MIFSYSAALSPTPQSPSPTSQRQQDSGFVEQLGDVSSEPLVVTNAQSTVESNKTEPVSILCLHMNVLLSIKTFTVLAGLVESLGSKLLIISSSKILSFNLYSK